MSEREKDLEKALEYGLKAQSISPENPGVMDTVGVIYYKLGDYVNASKKLEVAVKRLSKNPTIRYHYALVNIKIGEREAAIDELQAALDSGVDFPEASEAKKLLKEIK